MKKKITIVDYGLGNILSAEQSFKKIINNHNINAQVKISDLITEIKDSTHLVLPGQGAFRSCMNGLKKIKGMIDAIQDFALIQKKPFLGICVGMQLLATDSEENGKHYGLNWIPGHIKRLPGKGLKMPHMGWNEVIPKKLSENKLLIEEKDYYFIHSYYFDCEKEKNVMAYTKYGIDFASIVFKENIYGVQFHPEKSSDQGLKLIKSFVDL
tara:strand:+ start:1454 stop:2086 length:633 start_codon:yes stop_codon:yes gene_type:complete